MDRSCKASQRWKSFLCQKRCLYEVYRDCKRRRWECIHSHKRSGAEEIRKELQFPITETVALFSPTESVLIQNEADLDEKNRKNGYSKTQKVEPISDSLFAIKQDSHIFFLDFLENTLKSFTDSLNWPVSKLIKSLRCNRPSKSFPYFFEVV